MSGEVVRETGSWRAGWVVVLVDAEMSVLDDECTEDGQR